MCIVCEIKNKLAVTTADAEAIGFVMQRVELLARIAHNMSEFGRMVVDNNGVPRAALLDSAVMASACLSDTIEATERRNAEMAAMNDKGNAEALFDLIGSLIGLKRRNEAEDEGNPGLPPEVWAAMPASLREMMKGAKVVHLDIADDEALQKLFDAIKEDGQTKH